ncbi:MAG TPA: site-2 protease family protein, partial [Usitatibacter sp.]|nr:site-2 protease family protein [Usitatibacter sp.]
MDANQVINQVLIFAIPAVLAITLHEAAHGYVAKHFGDSTAYMLGRVTLNPIKHIDPLGTIVVPLVTAFTGFIFGWAKPVPV